MKMLVEIEITADWDHQTDAEAIKSLQAILESGAESCCADLSMCNVIEVIER